MRNGTFILLLAAVAACGGQAPAPGAAAPAPRLVATFQGTFDPAAHRLVLGQLRAARPGALVQIPDVSDNTSGTNPPDTVELVTESTTTTPGGCGAYDSLDASVTVRSFFSGMALQNVYVVIETMSPSGYEACNSVPATRGLSAQNGLFSYGNLGLAGSGSEAMTQTWSFAISGSDLVTFSGHVYADEGYAVGNQPRGVVWDGAAAWVSAAGAQAVVRVDGATGAKSTYPVGISASGLAFDGSAVWVGSTNGTTVKKLRASDGVTLGSYTAGNGPMYAAYDANRDAVWFTNYYDGTVTALSAADGSQLLTYPCGAHPWGVAYDASTDALWVANMDTDLVTRVAATDGTATGFPLSTPIFVAISGGKVWVTNYTSANTVSVLDASSGAYGGAYFGGATPFGITADDAHVWVTGYGNGAVVELRASDGAIESGYTAGLQPDAIALGGGAVWVANYGDGTLTKLIP